eukprot:m.114846 g.114846  ORF g.114846 m.114846 type:complete len:108 (-) comp13068_c0_seq1:2177-2500(-)
MRKFTKENRTIERNCQLSVDTDVGLEDHSDTNLIYSPRPTTEFGLSRCVGALDCLPVFSVTVPFGGRFVLVFRIFQDRISLETFAQSRTKGVVLVAHHSECIRCCHR